MNYQLNPLFSFVEDPFIKKAYIVAPDGSCNIVNQDAIKLMSQYIHELENNPSYQDFFEKVKSLSWIIPAQKQQALIRKVKSTPHLKRIQLELLLQCNLQCAHCYCSSSPSAPKGMSTERVLQLIDQASELGILYLDITGGEPLIRKDLFQIIEHAQTNGIRVSLFTNATVVTEEIAEKLAELKITSVQSSLDAFTPELHDHFRGANGAHSRAIRGIKLLRKYDIPLSVTVVVGQQNKHEIKQLATFIAHELKVPFRLDRIIPSGRALENNSIALSNQEFYELVRKEFPQKDVVVSKVCDFSSAIVNKSAIEPFCGVGASYLFIKHDGKVVLCPTMTEAEGPQFQAGELSKNSLEEIWTRHPTFQQFRGMQCKNVNICPSGSQCRGGCRSNAYLLHGSVDAPDEMQCNLHKNTQKLYRPFVKEYDEQAAHKS